MNPLRIANIQVQVRSTAAPRAYRIYIDDTKITERSWNLSIDYAINENLVVHVPLGRHKFRLIPISPESDFSLHQFHVNNQLVHKVCRSTEFDFVVDASLPAIV
jgi:hypothetical protein